MLISCGWEFLQQMLQSENFDCIAWCHHSEAKTKEVQETKYRKYSYKKMVFIYDFTEGSLAEMIIWEGLVFSAITF